MEETVFSPHLQPYNDKLLKYRGTDGARLWGDALGGTDACELSVPESALSFKALALPTKPLRIASALTGKAYMAVGQAGAWMHTMVVLQAYQADLLKDLDEGEDVGSDDVIELCQTTDLFLWDTKEITRALAGLCHSWKVLERHL